MSPLIRQCNVKLRATCKTEKHFYAYRFLQCINNVNRKFFSQQKIVAYTTSMQQRYYGMLDEKNFRRSNNFLDYE